MAKPPSGSGNESEPTKPDATSASGATAVPDPEVELAKILDLCTAARSSADALGETFLTYLLAMALEETGAALRRTLPTARPGD